MSDAVVWLLDIPRDWDTTKAVTFNKTDIAYVISVIKFWNKRIAHALFSTVTVRLITPQYSHY